MTDWRELGEVPDSEDEDGFDTQSTQGLPAFEPAIQPAHIEDEETPGQKTTDDVWEVPSSPLSRGDFEGMNIVPDAETEPQIKPTESAVDDIPEEKGTVAQEGGDSIWDVPSSLSHDETRRGHHVEVTADIKPITPETARHKTNAVPETDDAWDIPSSPEEEERQATIQRPQLNPSVADPALLPSMPSSSQDFPPIEQLMRGNTNHERPGHRISQGRDEADVSRTTIVINPSPISELGGATPAPHRSLLQAAQTPLPSQILGHDTEQEEARLVAISNERSFRKRKPEQMRPYAMEEARFRGYWKGAGMRGIRIANTEAERPRQEQADSQEEDFEPESQGSVNRAEDSQVDESAEMEGLLITGPPSSPMQTSPLDNKGGPSSQMGSQAGTENTSLDDDDEGLPTIQKLVKRMGHQAKRIRSLNRSAVSKRRRVGNPLESSPSRPAPLRLPVRQESPDPLGLPASQLYPIPSQVPSGRSTERLSGLETKPTEQTGVATDRFEFFASDDDPKAGGKEPQVYDISDDESNDSSDSSNSGSEVVHKNRGRIRGVLPASWLRIDQQTGLKQLQRKLQRPLDRSPERENRRGVAHRRQADPHTLQDKFLFSESEDETPPTTSRPTTTEIFPNQTRLPLQPLDNPPASENLSDDGASVMEEDYIDRMASGRKRQTKLTDTFGKAAKRQKAAHGTTAVPANRRNAQPKIMRAFNKTGNRSAGARQPSKKRTKKVQQGDHTRNRGPKRAQRPKAPQLSVLDVIEPGAPQFLRIAARTAKSRQKQGRASPTKKNIQFAHRQDHVDAAEVLEGWRRGTIKQRESVTAAQGLRAPRTLAQHRPVSPAAQPRFENRKPQLPRAAPRKLMKQVSDGGRVRYKAQATRPTIPRPPTDTPDRSAFQPAQLQTEAANFQNGVRLLDHMYRKGKRGAPTVVSEVSLVPTTRRVRKKAQPHRIDLTELHYSRAHDPIAYADSISPEPETVVHHAEGTKLLGLGPYGTHYTHHFEIFPLTTPGIYFHNSTLLGSGVLEAILHADHRKRLQESRPKAVLIMGEQILRWGDWNAQVSSEMGVVFDHISEQLMKASHHATANMPTSAGAADHLLSYVKDSVTFDSGSDVNSFLARSIEASQGFINRLPTDPIQASADLFQVCDRIGLFVFIALRICLSDSTLVGPRMQLEDLVKSLAVAIAKLLARTSSRELKQTYKKLEKVRARERGFRSDDQSIHSWTLLLRILENASIPRASFWDVVQEALLPTNLGSNTNAGQQERAWEDFFTLLPLTDFTDSGVLIAGGGQRAARDGWAMPQKLLKRVFQLYRANPHQSPGFNSYCRGLVARCHYLVQHWGWRKCSGIVGIIFDFFGSRSLEHLRNEESYDSPRFLEDLPSAQPLKVEPEDRCFHIFLKLLASSIQQLRKDDLIKDIRNLVARTLPNHNRQYSKEQTIHEHELAALRNHHDLLVTLYWAAPPHLRPHAELLERLVVPVSSHKEACLINLRAWKQVARFVISTGTTDEHGEVQTAFGPFWLWRYHFFEQMIQQLNTIASDIEQQFAGMSTDDRTSISRDLIAAMVSMNKAGIMDVIHLSMAASLDVMRDAPDLQAASHALSTQQLQRVFSSFAVSPPEMDWSILRVALTTLDTFLSCVDKEEQESQQRESQILNDAVADDALMELDEHVTSNYFKMARCVLASSVVKDTRGSSTTDRDHCTEQAIRLGARMSVQFISAGRMALGDLFKPGKYRLFGQLPHELKLEERKFLTLFITTLLKYGFDDFSAPGFTLQELYLLSIVRPQGTLAYENELANELVRHQRKFVPQTVLGLAITPDYSTNRGLFEFAIDHMRKSVRDASPSLKKDLEEEHARTLRLVMTQIQGDLSVVVGDSTQHPAYLIFVRSVISLIKAHGSRFCAIHDFFLQTSREYSPAQQDPELQVAGMTAYGLRVIEGDTRAESELFYLLLNRFKFAIMGNKLNKEVQLLAIGLRNPGILKFVTGSMLPAIIGAMGHVPTKILLDVYVQALNRFLDCEDESIILEDESLPQIKTIFVSILRAFGTLETGSVTLTNEDIHLCRQLVGLMNSLWPSIYMLLITGNASHDCREVESMLKDIKQVTGQAEICLSEKMNTLDPTVTSAELLEGLPLDGSSHDMEPTVSNLEGLIVKDIREKWDIGTQRITIQAPSRPTQSTQPVQGVERATFEPKALIEDLYYRIKEWNTWGSKAFWTPKQGLASCQEVLFF